MAHVGKSGSTKDRPCPLAGRCFGGILAFECPTITEARHSSESGVLLLDSWMKRPSKARWFGTGCANTYPKGIKEGPRYIWPKLRTRLLLARREISSKNTCAATNLVAVISSLEVKRV